MTIFLSCFFGFWIQLRIWRFTWSEVAVWSFDAQYFSSRSFLQSIFSPVDLFSIVEYDFGESSFETFFGMADFNCWFVLFYLSFKRSQTSMFFQPRISNCFFFTGQFINSKLVLEMEIENSLHCLVFCSLLVCWFFNYCSHYCFQS